MKVTDKWLYEGERIPFGWGVAWYEYETGRSVLLPWGINWLVGGVRAIYWRVANGFRVRDCKRDDSLYHKGKRDGWSIGYKMASERPIGLSDALEAVEKFWGNTKRRGA